MTPVKDRLVPRLLTRLLALAVVAAPLLVAAPVQAESYVPTSGAGSTWSANAIDQWRRNVNQYGLKVNYASTGSSDGRNQFKNGTVDFGVSEIPYGIKDGNTVDEPPSRAFAYMPIVAGGTAFMYNLKIGGKRVTDLRLSGASIAGIFTGTITQWNDPKIKADNPGLVLPARRIVPVVRSDGSGTTAQLTSWMADRHQQTWDAWCSLVGRPVPCGTTSNYPVKDGRGFVALAGSLNVSGYVAQDQSEGAITYVEYSYALNLRFPSAKVLNDGGYYVSPTASNVAVALLKAKVDENPSSKTYLTPDLRGVYRNTDPRSYQLSSYSYMIVPTALSDSFNNEKGKSLGAFAYYFLCQGQQEAEDLGYSPLPINLVEAGLKQVRRIPGVAAQDTDIKKCNNPTFSASGENTLAKNAPQPQACDKQGASQCVGTRAAGGTTPTGTTGGAAAPGTTGGSAAGATGGTTTAGTTGSGVAGAPVLPGTVSGAGSPGTVTVDPDTGAVITDGGAVDASGQQISAIPVSIGAGGVGSGTSLVLLAIAVLLAVTVLPPLLDGRLKRDLA